MLKINYPIIVEGKYDKAFLSGFIDALIIPTNGFCIYKNKEIINLIKVTATDKKIIVLTDSDNAGMQIRNHLKSIFKDFTIINVYSPQIKGKEKRKEKHSKEGFLGVEGQNKEEILPLIKNAVKLLDNNLKYKSSFTKNDLYFLNLNGTNNAKDNREKLIKKLNLPISISTTMLLEVINLNYSKTEFLEIIKEMEF